MKNIDFKPNTDIFAGIYHNRKRNPNKRYDKDIAPMLGIEPSTLTHRKKAPGTFKLAEFSKLVEYMGWTDQEILAVVRGDERYLVEIGVFEDGETEFVYGH